MMRQFAYIATGTLVVGLALYGGVFSTRHVSVENMASLQVLSQPRPQEKVTLVAVGDIMLSRAIGGLMAEKNDYAFPFASTTDVIRSADIAFANLESPVSTNGVRSGSIYSFRANPKAIEGLLSAGFDVVSFANNHVWDYGKTAFLDTLAHLEKAGIHAVGGGVDYPSAHEPKLIRAGETTFAFLGYTNLLPLSLGGASSTPSIARYDDDDAVIADIAYAKKLADVVVVSFHFGEEYKTVHNADQEHIARLAIDSGASLVIGHHPHVIQDVEKYKDGYIFYSLGNFVFDQNFSKDTKKGLLARITFQDSKISSVEQEEVAFSEEYVPYIVEKNSE